MFTFECQAPTSKTHTLITREPTHNSYTLSNIIFVEALYKYCFRLWHSFCLMCRMFSRVLFCVYCHDAAWVINDGVHLWGFSLAVACGRSTSRHILRLTCFVWNSLSALPLRWRLLVWQTARSNCNLTNAKNKTKQTTDRRVQKSSNTLQRVLYFISCL